MSELVHKSNVHIEHLGVPFNRERLRGKGKAKGTPFIYLH
jgi:hypothetical protein